ncbi:MAG: hypothetical protein ACM37U_00230, partial [Gemmatimonas sp.]|nr:hypothetical protein [Gemmatimonadaceae bacterium]
MRSLLLALVVAAPSFAQTPSMTTPPISRAIIIHADRVLDGRGKVIPGASVAVQGDKITKVGP